jgi:hypothetical protein
MNYDHHTFHAVPRFATAVTAPVAERVPCTPGPLVLETHSAEALICVVELRRRGKDATESRVLHDADDDSGGQETVPVRVLHCKFLKQLVTPASQRTPQHFGHEAITIKKDVRAALAPGCRVRLRGLSSARAQTAPLP